MKEFELRSVLIRPNCSRCIRLIYTPGPGINIKVAARQYEATFISFHQPVDSPEAKYILPPAFEAKHSTGTKAMLQNKEVKQQRNILSELFTPLLAEKPLCGIIPCPHHQLPCCENNFQEDLLTRSYRATTGFSQISHPMMKLILNIVNTFFSGVHYFTGIFSISPETGIKFKKSSNILLSIAFKW